MPKIDPRNAPGTIVHAATGKALGKCTAKVYLSNTNYCLTFLQTGFDPGWDTFLR